jgi:hypothetical protein
MNGKFSFMEVMLNEHSDSARISGKLLITISPKKFRPGGVFACIIHKI